MFQELEGRLGHQFAQSDLLKVALTHRSFHFENKRISSGHFERFEFLGDAVLDLILSESLMTKFPEVDEGTLSKWRASLVNESTLSEIGRELQLNDHLYLGKSELTQRENPRPRLLASSFEAILAAVYMDGGLPAAKTLVDRLFSERLSRLDDQNQFALDFKTRLQEWTQKRMKTVPEYRLVSSDGPEHNKSFKYEVLILGKTFGEGDGTSRKSAEQSAARNALEKIDAKEKTGEKNEL